ncbi:inositol monophosphatase family protein [Hahella ganghwensis]|uniref:inositol monophosphatase family protein n=1 Tax=Hahella ganghwensis TaxID=286420 RepID=UPI000378609C|nr:inositol monophosphatase [Hahella ganghwensis]
MQPMINIALRAIRSTNEQINLAIEREELSFSDPDAIKRVISRVDSAFYENVSRALQRAYPTHQINKKGDLKGNPKGISWHILPLHNPASLIRGLPDWCFSVICKKNDQPEHALVIFPQSGDEYTASRGSGASLNGKRLRTSKTKDLELTLVSTNILDGIGNKENPTGIFNTYAKLEKDCFGIRSAQCIPEQLVWIAAGKIDAVMLQHISPTETAAGLMIAKEAGALSADFNGNPLTDRTSNLICCNPKLLKNIAPRAKEFTAKPE